jgi:hypothetical protein
MALSKGINSYVTVAESDAYFKDRLDASGWSSADATMKANSLVTATHILDNFSWSGVATSETQLLAFPRAGSYFDPRLGTSVAMSGIPKRIETATFELANHLLNNEGLLDDTGRVLDLNIGPISLSKIQKPNLLPSLVKRLIAPLLINSGVNSWWRAN